MIRSRLLLPICLAAVAALMAQDEVVTFKSDVSLVRVDVQVLDRSQHAITGLQARDFVLRDEGQLREIRNFAAEEMPVDVLFLLDVSGSMRPHVERVAQAAQRAFDILGDDDRVAIMVFDRRSRVRLPFTRNLDQVMGGFRDLLDQETFDGGTDITRGFYDAAQYVRTNARKEARRAIVILTDDRTQRDRDDQGVLNALTRADAVLSALISPDAMGRMGGTTAPFPFPGGGGRGRGGVIFGPSWPGGRGGNGPVMANTRSAGTAEIARASGGDSMPIGNAGALETTLSRIRQRYAIYFLVPPGARAGEQRSIDVALTDAALRRYPGAETRFRRTYVASSDVAPVEVSQTEEMRTTSKSDSSSVTAEGSGPRLKRRPSPVVLDNPTGPRNPSASAPADSGWRRDSAGGSPGAEASAATAPAAGEAPAQSGGWRRVKPDEKN